MTVRFCVLGHDELLIVANVGPSSDICDESRGTIECEVVPSPLDQNKDAILEADDLHQVNE